MSCPKTFRYSRTLAALALAATLAPAGLAQIGPRPLDPEGHTRRGLAAGVWAEPAAGAKGIMYGRLLGGRGQAMFVVDAELVENTGMVDVRGGWVGGRIYSVSEREPQPEQASHGMLGLRGTWRQASDGMGEMRAVVYLAGTSILPLLPVGVIDGVFDLEAADLGEVLLHMAEREAQRRRQEEGDVQDVFGEMREYEPRLADGLHVEGDRLGRISPLEPDPVSRRIEDPWADYARVAGAQSVDAGLFGVEPAPDLIVDPLPPEDILSIGVSSGFHMQAERLLDAALFAPNRSSRRQSLQERIENHREAVENRGGALSEEAQETDPSLRQALQTRIERHRAAVAERGAQSQESQESAPSLRELLQTRIERHRAAVAERAAQGGEATEERYEATEERFEETEERYEETEERFEETEEAFAASQSAKVGLFLARWRSQL